MGKALFLGSRVTWVEVAELEQRDPTIKGPIFHVVEAGIKFELWVATECRKSRGVTQSNWSV